MVGAWRRQRPNLTGSSASFAISDVDFVETLSDDDLPRIQKEMLSILKKGIPFIRKEVSREEALVLFKEQKYKLDLIREFSANEKISIYER